MKLSGQSDDDNDDSEESDDEIMDFEESDDEEGLSGRFFCYKYFFNH